MLDIEIDGQQVEVPEGSTVMDAAVKLGVYVPHFCYHKKLSIAASCRMCLVEVEKAPKPLPACATPVTKGMKVKTHSPVANKAQQGVMEFLLVNHPLDCPICDQGGECQLQDLAVGYGGSGSRYQEEKRVVVNKNLGPLISTDMTRCIHCTRCVRFGQEIAGVMELGVANRGERSEIMAFVGTTVDSELSGNSIDLCPVGALTSKPFRFAARSWELTRRNAISPHCGLGSNVVIQSKNGAVKRVLPAENEAVNECWLSDKDRFAYEALNSPDRLTVPLVRKDGGLTESTWQEALSLAGSRLKALLQASGPECLGVLISPHATLEELFLAQKLARDLGCGNVDFRLRSAAGGPASTKGIPWLGMRVAELEALDRALCVGSFLRKDHPLLAHRLRKASRKGLRLSVVHAQCDDLLMPVDGRVTVAPAGFVSALAHIALAVTQRKHGIDAEWVRALATGAAPAETEAIADSLASGERVGVFLGNFAESHPDAAMLHGLASVIADAVAGRTGFLGAAANSVGGYVAGACATGTAPGLSAAQMMATPRKAYVLVGVDPLFDLADPVAARSALQTAEFVVQLTAFQSGSEFAHVVLPISPFSETSGTYVNTEGRLQSFVAAVPPMGDSRPGWKVLRVLGSQMGLQGWDYASSADVLKTLFKGCEPEFVPGLDNTPVSQSGNAVAASNGVQRVADVPIYSADPIVRRSPVLQRTADGVTRGVRVHPDSLQALGLRPGGKARVSMGHDACVLDVVADERLALGCVGVSAARAETVGLGPMFGEVTVEPA